jgi:hypothetical protein
MRSMTVVFERQQRRRNFMTRAAYAHGMTTASRSVAVVATQLPSIDRRALSQAWFSALHLAQPAPCATAARARTPIAAGAGANGRAGAAVPPHIRPGPGLAANRSAPAKRGDLTPPAVERRSPAGELARRIERGVLRHAARGAQRNTSVAIDAGDGRIAILIRTEGSRTRIVALCSPPLRERVDRALAHARFALAGAGLRLEVPA